MANTPLGFPFGFYVADNSPIDGKYGVLDAGAWRPYTTMAEALAAIPQGIRHIGLTINIGGTEYWWAQGLTDQNLVVKNNGSGGGGVMAWKNSVRAATTANITLSTTQTIDGIALAAGDRVLVKNQTTQSDNGIYVVASGAWTRATDADASNELQNAVVSVDQGTVNADTSWRQNTDSVVIGTSAIVWSSFGAGAAITATNGLTKTLDNIKLGGSLTENTTIAAGTRNLSITRGASQITMNQDILLLSSGFMFLSSTNSIYMDAGANTVNISGTNLNIADIAGGGGRFLLAYTNTSLLTTTNAPAILYTLDIPADRNVTIRATVTARRTGGSSGANGDIASFELVAAFKNPGHAAATQVGATFYPYTFKSQPAWDVIFDTSGNDARISVIGANGNNITWSLNKVEVFRDS
ncbi:hypothetical protein [Dawidia soli]|uniref:Uncharacterized protein n=1 Tax=Dawidia soli TaxID=2782352 RepID=A0AAP2GG32_9BACT|nr:hypothetical protein [Dawidia soli]MBT1690109.1 hypothetical protein [Dawidia soli]